MTIDLIGVIDENDYIRYSQKFLKERKKVEENIESLKQKIDFITSNEEKEVPNQEVNEKMINFLKADYINQEVLSDIVDRIEIDENKKVYIHFNFQKLNIYNDEEKKNVSIP